MKKTIKETNIAIYLGANLAFLALFSATGCASSAFRLEDEKINYKSASKGTSLDVPPDLSQLSQDKRYTIPKADGLNSGEIANSVSVNNPSNTASQSTGNVHIERSGDIRWLVTTQSPEQVWPILRDFWTGNGFELVKDDAVLGIMETDWAENRAKIEQDFIRSALGGLLDALYSTGERDKFRIRIEPMKLQTGKQNSVETMGTEIYLSHKGMVEETQNNKTDGAVKGSIQTVWTNRPTDHQLEAEFLRRLMLKLGATKEQAKQEATQAGRSSIQKLDKLQSIDGKIILQLEQDFDRTWRRVGLALDRTGFTVEDRNRAQGVYFVRYAPESIAPKEPSLFGRLLGEKPVTNILKYRITVQKATDLASHVSVLNENGTSPTDAVVKGMLKVLSDEIN